METPIIFESERQFMEILWDHEPVSSVDLVKYCNDALEWKKSTTYTVIRRLSQRGIIQSEKTIVTSLVTREEVESYESGEFVERKFSGSLPGFLTAFTREKKLSKDEIAAIEQLIEQMRD